MLVLPEAFRAPDDRGVGYLPASICLLDESTVLMSAEPRGMRENTASRSARSSILHCTSASTSIQPKEQFTSRTLAVPPAPFTDPLTHPLQFRAPPIDPT